MSWVIIALLIVAAVFVLYWVIRFIKDGAFAVRCFERGNCIVAGHKGNGKDLFFSFIIKQRHKRHYSNIRYNEKTIVLDPRAFNIDPNTYRNFLDGNVVKIEKQLEEGLDYYLSDGGIFMPSTYQGEMIKLYPSLPLMYAIQRHLYNSNFHVNVQNLPRLWDKIREQADYYFWACQSIRIGKRTFIQKLRYYENYEAAKMNVIPFKIDRRLLLLQDKRQDALKHQFDAQNGCVKYLYIFNRLPKQHYDTRYFHSVLFGQPAPTGKEQRHEAKRKSKNRHSTDQ